MRPIPHQPNVRLAFYRFFTCDDVRKQLRLEWKNPDEADVVVEVECIPDSIGLNGTRILEQVSQRDLVLDLAKLLADTEEDGPLIHTQGGPEEGDVDWLLQDYYGETGLPKFETELLQFCWCRDGQRASFGESLLALGMPRIRRCFERYGTLDHAELIHFVHYEGPGPD